MTHRARQALLLGVALASAGCTVAVSRAVAARYARHYAERSAITIAAYLSLVTPPNADRSDYDLGQLLVRARALDLVPEWASQVEVYHGTAPLVRATRAPLAPATLDRLRREEAVEWRADDVLVPLTDRDQWNVVGAVAVRVPVLGPGWALPALVITLVALAAYTRARTPSLRARAHSFYWMAALALGIGAVDDVVGTAHGGTNRWLAATRILVQEAARVPGRPDLAELAAVARGGTLVPRDSGVLEVRLVRTSVRLGGGRWAELRSPQPDTRGWVLCLVGLVLVGPGVLSVGTLAREESPGGVSAS
jgi:hypothetical protein